MVITLDPNLEAVSSDIARKQGMAPEDLVLSALRERFLTRAVRPEPQDERERGLLDAARDCGVSLPYWALSSEGLYD